LDRSDLASLARVCRRVNAVSVPYLYRSVYFDLPTRIEPSDPLLAQLETFTDSSFDLLKHTLQVVVSGDWYEAYDAVIPLEGRRNILSPAVRMFNALLTACVGKMPKLKKFYWDAHIPPVQRLVSKLAIHPSIQTLRIQTSVDHIPNPYHYPALRFHNFGTLQSLNLVQIDKNSVLESIGMVLNTSHLLTTVSLWADIESQLSLAPLLLMIDRVDHLPVKRLDLRGFAEFHCAVKSLWAVLSPTVLIALTIELGDLFDADEDDGVWGEAIAAQIRLKTLTVSHVTTGLANYILSFKGLETVHLMPCNITRPIGPFWAFVEALTTNHSGFLRVLGLCPQDVDDNVYLLDAQTLLNVTENCSHLVEFGFGIHQDMIDNVDLVFQLSRLKVLLIQVFVGSMSEEDEDNGGQILQFRNRIAQSLEQDLCPDLKYVAFDEGPVYSVETGPQHVRRLIEYPGRVRETVLLQQEMLNWIDDVY
ncbi:MAG: hypothetical protein M1837_003449, partial [Sclerophora amabilis]